MPGCKPNHGFTDHSKAVLLLLIVFVSYASCLVCVLLWCLFFAALLSPAVKRADLLAVVFVVFCHFPNCVLVHIRIRGKVGAIKLVQALQ